MKEQELDEVKSLLLCYNAALKTLETQLSILLQDFEYKNHYNPVEHMKSRIKTYDSAAKKLTKRGYDITVDNIEKYVHDMVGIRIVCSFLPEVYKIVDLIESSEQISVRKKKDYISKPKDSGYSSYHLLVDIPVYLIDGVKMVEAEIQIRTLAMDFWASLEHKTRYKFQGEVPREIEDNLYRCAMDINELDHKMLILNDKMKYFMEDHNAI